MTDIGFAVYSPPVFILMILDKFITGKVRLKILTKFLLNPATTAYLRGLQKDLRVSSNTVRVELNKLSDMQLIQELPSQIVKGTSTKTKYYSVNTKHPLFKSLRRLILQNVGLDQIIEHILSKLGNIDEVYLIGDLAQGKNSLFVDLVIVGEIDKSYLYQLIEKVEKHIEKKIRIVVYHPNDFDKNKQNDLGVFMKLMT